MKLLAQERYILVNGPRNPTC